MWWTPAIPASPLPKTDRTSAPGARVKAAGPAPGSLPVRTMTFPAMSDKRLTGDAWFR